MGLPLSVRLCVSVVLASTLAYLTTPLAIGAARRFAFYDVPLGYKGHVGPTPYLGGMAVMSAFALALLIGAGDLSRSILVLGCVGALVVIGTIDDRVMVSPQLRVAIEFGLGALLAGDGLGWRFGSGGWIDAVITGAWVVAVVNAFNLFDNMDGAASAMGLVVAAGTSILAIVIGDVWVAAGSAALCGACLGFLPHNLSSPARVFLGDGGSMPLGFAVAILVAGVARGAAPAPLGLLVGFLLVGIPALDTSLVIVSRCRRGVGVLTGGQDHLTHRMRRRMGTARRVALVLGGAQALVSALVIVASRQGSATLVYIALAFVIFAAAAIMALEDVVAVGGAPQTVANLPRRATGSGGSLMRSLPAVGLGAVGLGAGLSPLFSAYYDPGLWVPIGFVLVIVAAAATIADPPRATLPVTLALVGLSGLGLWSLVSTSWAQAVEQATMEANLWLAYVALFVLVLVLIRRRRHATWLLAAIGVAITAVAISVLVRMLGGDAGTMFLAGRLNSPLGYVNGEGCVFAMGGWLSLALAEWRRPALAGVGMAATVALTSLELLSQSRGAAIATFVAVLVALIAVPGFRRRMLVLAGAVAGVAVAASPVLSVYAIGQTGVPATSAAHRAATTILLASMTTGVAWALLVGLANRMRAHSGASRRLVIRVATVAAAVLAAAPVVVAVAAHSPIEHKIQTQWSAFTHLSSPASSAALGTSNQTRLFSGAGNRYDYWRVAWRVFIGHPWAGVGAGNYPASYFRQRRTQEAIENPHSIELQTLAELGLVGASLLALLLAGVAIGARRLRAGARGSAEARATLLGATGIAVVWTVDTSGDWMHLLPGVSAVALCGFAVLCRAAAVEPVVARRVAGKRLPSLIGAAAITFVLAVGGAGLLRAGITRLYLNAARENLATDPAAAVTDARRALQIDAADLDAYYVKAAGQARFDRAAAARLTLLQAAHQDGGDYVTWTLLGDLERRTGDAPGAYTYYRRALLLDPREPSLRALAAKSGRRARGSGR